MTWVAGLKTTFRRNPFIASAFVLTTVIALSFGGRFIYHAVYWSLHREEPVRPWMTVGYIGRSWNIKPRAIDEITGLPPPQGGKPMTLSEIAKQRGVPVGTVIAEVETAIQTLKATGQPKDGQHEGATP